MTFHPVLDAEELARALDAAPIESLLAALVRRAKKAMELGEAAYHQATRELDRASQRELITRCATSARVCRNLSEAVHAIAPMSAFDLEAAAHARRVVNVDRLAAYVELTARAAERKAAGHA